MAARFLGWRMVGVAFIGFGASAMGGLATAKLVTNWFSRRRGTALGIAATGISASGVVMPYVTATLIEQYGWREGFLVYGAFTALVVVPLVLRLVISSPEEVGLRPDGQRPGATPPATTTEPPGPARPHPRRAQLLGAGRRDRCCSAVRAPPSPTWCLG
jgi:sugar phosphate permease